MFDRYEIEEMILGMAKIVKENRALRKALNEAEMEVEKYKAYSHGDYKKGDILSDISIHNASANSVRSMGGLTSQEYIEDWEAELERRMAEPKGCEVSFDDKLADATARSADTDSGSVIRSDVEFGKE